jgi:predicted ABC-type ATPase
VTLPPDPRPRIVALAGPNGAGKSTFFQAHLQPAGLRFVNAEDLARELGVDAYAAAELANEVRRSLVAQRESFVFETVLSDPVGDKVNFLRAAARSGYTVVLCFIGLDSAETSGQRVAMRVLQGGHDVPNEKLAARYARTLENLHRAIRALPSVHVFDNSDLRHPFRKVAEVAHGKAVSVAKSVPDWLELPWDRSPETGLRGELDGDDADAVLRFVPGPGP